MPSYLSLTHMDLLEDDDAYMYIRVSDGVFLYVIDSKDVFIEPL